MAIPDLAEEILALSLSDPKYLLFCPSGDKALLQTKFDDIPRYLFRVYTPKSRGTTDRFWTKSMDATNATEQSRVDILAREDNAQVASMLITHLRWWKGPGDNFVSWTSSMLFALVYIFHLHANSGNKSAFDEIFLCIIDTTKFPKGVFLRDMDLIQAYSPFNTKLEYLKGLRLKKEWYFGEYLSQGALRIEDKCQVVSALAMINRGLYTIRREFKDFASWEPRPKPPWAQPVVDLRKNLCQLESPEISREKLVAAVNVAELFGSYWTLPIAANLIALLTGSMGDVAIIQEFRANTFTDDDRANCSRLKTKVVAFESLPEVEQFGEIMRNVYRDFCATKLESCIGNAEIQLRLAVEFVQNEMFERQDSTSLESINNAVKGRLDMERHVNQQLREMISGRKVLSKRTVKDLISNSIVGRYPLYIGTLRPSRPEATSLQLRCRLGPRPVSQPVSQPVDYVIAYVVGYVVGYVVAYVAVYVRCSLARLYSYAV